MRHRTAPRSASQSRRLPPPSADVVATALRPPVEITPSAPLPGAEDVLGVVAAFPDTLDAVAAVADGVKVADSFSGHIAGQFDLRFTRAADAPRAAAPEPSGGTDVYALAKAVDTAGAGAMIYDEIQWFWAPDAAQKCAEDRGTPNGAWCTDYYYRNVNDRLRTAALDSAAIITMVPNGPPPESATLAQLAARVGNGLEFPCVLHVDGGTVLRIDQIFTP